MIHISLGTLACLGVCCRSTVLEKLTALWQADIMWRVGRWGPTKALVETVGPKSYGCHIKGQCGVLRVHGLWSEREAEMGSQALVAAKARESRDGAGS